MYAKARWAFIAVLFVCFLQAFSGPSLMQDGSAPAGPSVSPSNDVPITTQVRLNTFLNLVTIGIAVVGGYLLKLANTGTEEAVKTSAAGLATAINDKLQWPAVIARELQKTRGIERQELRFKSYGLLWGKLRPLAIYDDEVIDKHKASELFSCLSDWYFSENGGLLLTPQSRNFYFALQDLLWITSRLPEDWSTKRSYEAYTDLRHEFRTLLEELASDAAIVAALSVFDYFKVDHYEDWPDESNIIRGEQWKKGINHVAAAWKEIDETQRFVALQQVGSMLRTSLTNDLESRLR